MSDCFCMPRHEVNKKDLDRPKVTAFLLKQDSSFNTFWLTMTYFDNYSVTYLWGQVWNYEELKSWNNSPYLWSSSSESSLDTHPGWLSMALPILLRARLFSRLSTSCSASFPAASLPLHSVARVRWLLSKVDTWRAKPECSRSSTNVPEMTMINIFRPRLNGCPLAHNIIKCMHLKMSRQYSSYFVQASIS